MVQRSVYCVLLQFFIFCAQAMGSTWSEWWTYTGISGPTFWGHVNPEWQFCSKGKKQSPINIDPRHLLYDGNLNNLHIDKRRMSGTLMNTGHDIKLVLDEPSQHYINISGGPFVYQYRISEIIIHFGHNDSIGSEHTIDGKSFPAEVQIIGYNTDLYGNMTQAVYSAHGLAMIALLAQIGNRPNQDFDIIAQNIKQIRYRGQQARIRHVSVAGLFPPTTDYLTYEGSQTQPGCYESVTWLVLNKPMYITREHLVIMREAMQGDEENPKGGIENNFRPTMPSNHRTVRTNIDFPKPTKACSVDKQSGYKDKTLGMVSDWQEDSGLPTSLSQANCLLQEHSKILTIASLVFKWKINQANMWDRS